MCQVKDDHVALLIFAEACLLANVYKTNFYCQDGILLADVYNTKFSCQDGMLISALNLLTIHKVVGKNFKSYAMLVL